MRWFTNALVAAISVVVALVAAEVGLQFTPYRYLVEPRILVFPEGYFQSDPELGFDLAPNRPPARMRFRGPGHVAFTNSFGCFDWERRVEPGYVLAIGDSMTWGWAALEEKWTSLLEDRMGTQVVKCGVPGTGTRYQALKMKRTIEKIGFPPSIVIWLYIDNDFNDDVGFPTDTAVGGELISTIQSLDLRSGVIGRADAGMIKDRYERMVERRSRQLPFRERLILAGLLRQARESLRDSVRPLPPAPAEFGRPSTPGPVDFGPVLRNLWEKNLNDVDAQRYPWVANAFEQHTRMVLSLQALVEGYGAQLVFVRGNANLDSPLQTKLDERLRTEFKHYFDFTTYERAHGEPRDMRYVYDNHWNTQGNRLAADGIFEFLQHEGLVPAGSGARANDSR